MIDSAAMTAEKYGFNFERAPRFRAGLQNVLSAYKELHKKRSVRLSSQAYCRVLSLPH